MIRCNIRITQLFGLLVGTYNDAWGTPAMPTGKETLATNCKSGFGVHTHIAVIHILHLYRKIFTVAMQQVLGSYSLVEVILST